MEPKFHFNDFVEITSGFYKGTMGDVLSLVCEVPVRGEKSESKYKVLVELFSVVKGDTEEQTLMEVTVKEDQLKLVEHDVCTNCGEKIEEEDEPEHKQTAVIN